MAQFTKFCHFLCSKFSIRKTLISRLVFILVFLCFVVAVTFKCEQSPHTFLEADIEHDSLCSAKYPQQVLNTTRKPMHSNVLSSIKTIKTIQCKCIYNVETNQLLFTVNKLIGFVITGLLPLNGQKCSQDSPKHLRCIILPPLFIAKYCSKDRSVLFQSFLPQMYAGVQATPPIG